jgi:rhodanese-related sulfurtransferase
MSIYIIDIREEEEIVEKYLVSAKSEYQIMNIPLRYIGFNQVYINNLTQDGVVYLICRSGNRSNRVKLDFFMNNNNVKSLEGGLNGLTIFDGNVAIITENGAYTPKTYMKMVILIIIIYMLVATYINLDSKYIYATLAPVLIFIIYQLVSSSCLMDKIVPIYKPKV